MGSAGEAASRPTNERGETGCKLWAQHDGLKHVPLVAPQPSPLQPDSIHIPIAGTGSRERRNLMAKRCRERDLRPCANRSVDNASPVLLDNYLPLRPSFVRTDSPTKECITLVQVRTVCSNINKL